MMKRFFGSRSSKGTLTYGGADFPIATEVESYWQALRAQNHVPKRSDLDPRGIRRALSKAFILDSTDPDAPRFRIVGSDLTDLHQGDLRGCPLMDLVADHRRAAIQYIVRDVSRLPAQAQLDFSAETVTGEVFDLRMILLPMTDTNDGHTRILGCLDYDPVAAMTRTTGAGLVPTGSIVRPLGSEDQAIVRKMQHRGLKLVSTSEPQPQPKSHSQAARHPEARPHLTLVTN